MVFTNESALIKTLGENSNAIISGAAGLATGAVLGGAAGYAMGKKSSSRRRRRVKPHYSRKSSHHYKKRHRHYPRTAGKRKDRSHRRIRYTKNGQPYVILASGKARFISLKSAHISHRRKGGRY